MKKDKTAIIIGYGEIGKAIYGYIGQKCVVIDVVDPEKGYTVDPCHEFGYDFMMVCMPYTDNFVEIINKYKYDYSPKCIVIFSTVAIGTTKLIKSAVHIPLEGKHPNLCNSIRAWKFFVGYNRKSDLETVRKFFYHDKCVPVKNTDTTEAFKLLSTTLYGVNIEYARLVDNVCKELDLNYETWKEYNKNYNYLYSHLGMDNFQRYILDPPEGKIGGHCVVNNIPILEKNIQSIFLKIVKDGEMYGALCGDNPISEG